MAKIGQHPDDDAGDPLPGLSEVRKEVVQEYRSLLAACSPSESRAMCGVALRLPDLADDDLLDGPGGFQFEMLKYCPRSDTEGQASDVHEAPRLNSVPRTMKFLACLGRWVDMLNGTPTGDAGVIVPLLARLALVAHKKVRSSARGHRKLANHQYDRRYRRDAAPLAVGVGSQDHLTLLVSLTPGQALPADHLAVLKLLAEHRMLGSAETYWRRRKSSPDEDKLRELLDLTAGLTWTASPPNEVSSSLLTIARQLAGEARNAEVLQSPSYRCMLWDSLDSVLWRELLRCKAERLFPGEVVPPTATAKSLLLDAWLVAEYGYIVLGVERDFAIHDHFVTAMRHEVMLYHGKDGYRDHLQHSLNTFLLGYALLAIPQRPFPTPTTAAAGKKLLRDWLVAALFHDFGYVMDLIPAVFRFAGHFESTSVQGITKSLRELWQQEVKALNAEAKDELKIKTDLGGYSDHGLFSYYQLRNIMLKMDRGRSADPGTIKNGNSDTCKKYKRALGATLFHNMSRQPVKMRPSGGNLLAGVLVICDEIQDWDRPRHKATSLVVAGASLTHFQAGQISDSRQTTEKVEIHFGRAFDGVATEFTEVTVDFADQNVNMFDPICRLLGTIHNWERIQDVRGLPLIVRFQIPRLRQVALIPGSAPKPCSEIGLLREFCLLAEAGCVSSQLFDCVSPDSVPSRCCSHFVGVRESPDDLVDVVCVNFHEFPESPRDNGPLIRRPPWDFQEKYQAFKQDYCRKHGVPCEYLNGDYPWPIDATLGPV